MVIEHPIRVVPRSDRRRCYCLTAGGIAFPATSVDAWCEWLATADLRVAVTVVPPFYTVSTMFTGLDYAAEGAPVLWETLVFRRAGLVVDSHRYHSRAEALIGHKAIVDAYRLRVLPYTVLAVLVVAAAAVLSWSGVL